MKKQQIFKHNRFQKIDFKNNRFQKITYLKNNGLKNRLKNNRFQKTTDFKKRKISKTTDFNIIFPNTTHSEKQQIPKKKRIRKNN